MILIDNIKTFRNFIYLLKLNNNLKKFKYVIFCSGLQNSISFNNDNLENRYFLKKIKYLQYLKVFSFCLTNIIIIYGTNEDSILLTLLQNLDTNIIFCKINNNIYSLNNIKNYLTSKLDLVYYLNNYYLNFIYSFEKLNFKI